MDKDNPTIVTLIAVYHDRPDVHIRVHESVAREAIKYSQRNDDFLLYGDDDANGKPFSINVGQQVLLALTYEYEPDES